ncbi:MAG: hypothetical protein ACOY4K_00635 [Pseudomonadota bacterium]
MRAAAIMLAATLAGCATTTPPEPVVRTVEVKVPVPVPCEDRRPSEPEWPDTPDAIREAAASGADAIMALFLASRGLYRQRLAEDDVQIETCEGE